MNVFSRFSTILVAVALATGLLLAAGADTSLAQTSDQPEPGMLPDHPMYFMTRMSESVGTFFTFGEVNQAERSLNLSERRLAEARAFAADDKPDEAEKAVERYQVQLDRALSKAKQAQANGSNADAVLSGVSEATPRHQEVLEEVHQKVPEQARPGIERAMEASRRGGAQAREATSEARGRRGTAGRPDSSDQNLDRPDRDRSDNRGAEARPESAGPPSHAQGEGPPSSRGQNRPDDAPDTDRPDEDERPDSLDQDVDGPDRDRSDNRGAEARPESAGPPSHAQGKGPPSSRGQNRPNDAPDTDRPDENERPDSSDEEMDRPEIDRPDAEDRPDRGERGKPDSVDTGPPENPSGR